MKENLTPILIGLLLPMTLCAKTILVPFTNGAPLPVSNDQQPKLFQQCSRRAPQPTEILGVPTTNEISELELKLELYIAEVYESGKNAPPTITYARQYVAFRIGNQWKIYGNFFPRSLANQVAQKKTAVVACDGGPAFWGVVYDPVTKKFEGVS